MSSLQAQVQTSQELLVSAYPHPPVWYTKYSSQNAAEGHVPSPPLPLRGSFQIFGADFSLEDGGQPIATLECTRLFSEGEKDFDRVGTMKKLTRSLLFNYVQLLESLAKCPEQCHSKINDLRTLFLNFHQLINEFRPHQARETLRLILETQINRRRKAKQDLDECVEKIQTALHSHRASLSQTDLDDLSTISSDAEMSVSFEEGTPASDPIATANSDPVRLAQSELKTIVYVLKPKIDAIKN